MDVIKKCGLFVALFALSVTVLSGSLSNDVNAASEHDNKITTVDQLFIGFEPHVNADCPNEDVSLNWFSTADTANNPNADTIQFMNDLRDAISGENNLGWGVAQEKSTYLRFYIYLFDNDTQFNFGSTSFTTDKPVREMRVGKNTSVLPCQTIYASINSRLVRTTNTVTYKNWYLNTSDNINYPSGYEGEHIPDTVTPTTTLKFAPDWQATKYKDFKVDFADNNFFTIDNNPFLCGEDGFAPIIEYTIVRDDNGQLIDEGQFSASSNLSYQFEKVPERRDYTITGTYTDCDGANFTESSSFTFMFNEAGSQHLVNWAEECVNTEFPFFHIQSCMYWFENLVNTFSFGTIAFSNDWSFQPQCRNLTTIGSWFKADSINVCPQVPQYVRNVVTPFVTFALGLLTIRFIATRSSDDYGGMK